jgi:trimeric autotransporter adhesin
MNKTSIFRSLATIVAVVCASFASFAGTGTSADPYTVCAVSGYKLTASTTGAAAYRWKDITNGTTPSGTTANLEVAAQTGITSVTTLHYTVEAQSTAGCYSDPQDIYVTLVPAPTLTAPTLANICAVNTGGTASTINLSAPTSSAPTLPTGVTIAWGNWSGGTGTGAVTQTGSGTATTPQPSASGSYSYAITATYSGMNVGGSACSSTATASVTIDALPAAPTTTIGGI